MSTPEYHKEYARLHHERLKEYRKEWIRRKRAGERTKGFWKREKSDYFTSCRECHERLFAHPRCGKCEELLRNVVPLLCAGCKGAGDILNGNDPHNAPAPAENINKHIR